MKTALHKYSIIPSTKRPPQEISNIANVAVMRLGSGKISWYEVISKARPKGACHPIQ
jgi:hypothetical protein